jgi:hypothetical protein
MLMDTTIRKWWHERDQVSDLHINGAQSAPQT